MTEPLRIDAQAISRRAHELWLKRGCPTGTPELDWVFASEGGGPGTPELDWVLASEGPGAPKLESVRASEGGGHTR